MLEDLVVGLLYLPFLIAPFALLFWYAFAANRHSEVEQVQNMQAKPLDEVSQRPSQ